MNKDIKIEKTLLVLLILLIFTNPYAYAQVSCSGSTVVCDNGGTPSCSHYASTATPSCRSDGLLQCCIPPSGGAVGGSVFCGYGYYGPECPTQITTYSCDAGYTICPNNTTSTAVCCQYGCCPSDSTKCKCSRNNQCSPNCTLPTPPPITYTCDSGYTSCPDNRSNLCCPNGCCPSDPNKCKCPDSNQCSPNCTLPTPIPTLQPTPPTPETSGPTKCNSSTQCNNGHYCNFNFLEGGTQIGHCSENPSGCVTGCTNDNQCSGDFSCDSNCCVPKLTPQPTPLPILEPTPSTNSNPSATNVLNSSFTGLWKGIITKPKLGQSRVITLKLCVIGGELEGIVNQKGAINNAEIISQEVISEQEIKIEVVDQDDNIELLNLKLLNDRRLSVLINGTNLTTRKLSSNKKCLLPNLERLYSNSKKIDFNKGNYEQK